MATAVSAPPPAPVATLRRDGRRVARTASVATATVVAAGLAITALAPPRAFGSWLGAPSPPFFTRWLPNAAPWALLAAATLAAGVAVAPLLVRRLAPVPFAGAVLALGLAERLVLATARIGPAGWAAPLGRAPTAPNEYLYGLPAIHGLGIGPFLDRFAQLEPSLPLHASAHPPGLLVTFELFGLRTPGAVAALFIGGGALAVPLTYALGRQLGTERSARVAALLFAFAPSALIFGATCADALFATLGLAAALALLSPHRAARALGAFVLLPLAAFFSYSLLAIGALSVAILAARHGPRAAVRLALLCALGLVTAYGGLYALTGFDPLGAVRSANLAYRGGINFSRPYWYWLFGSPVAWLVSLGIPTAWLWLRRAGQHDRVALALALVVAVASILGFAKAETERIWLFLVPFACLGAGALVRDRTLRPVLGLLAFQALAVELLLWTIW